MVGDSYWSNAPEVFIAPRYLVSVGTRPLRRRHVAIGVMLLAGLAGIIALSRTGGTPVLRIVLLRLPTVLKTDQQGGRVLVMSAAGAVQGNTIHALDARTGALTPLGWHLSRPSALAVDAPSWPTARPQADRVWLSSTSGRAWPRREWPPSIRPPARPSMSAVTMPSSPPPTRAARAGRTDMWCKCWMPGWLRWRLPFLHTSNRLSYADPGSIIVLDTSRL